ncbi:MAG: Asp-tRNA(Asn)/Glu-tRNA(Gln) amidotransferase subunit GatB [Saprospiraceae bacterium]
MQYETVIGLEIHVQLATRSKAFCADDASFGGAPNTHTSAVSLAHPGTLPRLNKKAVEYAVRLGLALGCDIARRSTFDRKNYFYADLPKGFQTTQQNNPICVGGGLKVEGRGRRVEGGEWKVEGTSAPSTLYPLPSTIRIHHIHLEEDAGKSLHDQDPFDSLIDLNRAGVPLLEIVTEPDLRSAEEVASFMAEIRRLVRWLGISDGNMEEGSLRCDVNVSVRKIGEEKLGQRCEIKNVNSMRFARRAIEFEVKRQIEILEKGGKIEQETRGFDADSGTTYSLREKEEAHDYRYFPEPDLPPVVISDSFLENIKSEMPPLPQALEQEFQTKYGLSAQDADLLSQERETAFYFLQLTTSNQQLTTNNRQISNLIINKLLPWSASTGTPLSQCPVPPAAWLEFLNLIENGQVSASTAYQRLFPVLMENPDRSPTDLATELNLLQNADTDFLEKLADEVLARFPEKVAEYRNGKKGLIGFFMGELMKASKGKAEPKAATRLLEAKLK